VIQKAHWKTPLRVRAGKAISATREPIQLQQLTIPAEAEPVEDVSSLLISKEISRSTQKCNKDYNLTCKETKEGSI